MEDNSYLYNGYHLSGWWRRAVAFIIDQALIMVILVPCFTFLMGVIFTSSTQVDAVKDNLNGTILLSIFCFSVVVNMIYYGFSMSRSGERHGQTFGKQLMNIKVIREDEKPLTLTYIYLRQIVVIQLLVNCLLMIVSLTLLPIVNYIYPLYDNKRQAIHDKIVSSRVIRSDIPRRK